MPRRSCRSPKQSSGRVPAQPILWLSRTRTMKLDIETADCTGIWRNQTIVRVGPATRSSRSDTPDHPRCFATDLQNALPRWFQRASALSRRARELISPVMAPAFSAICADLLSQLPLPRSADISLANPRRQRQPQRSRRRQRAVRLSPASRVSAVDLGSGY